jgi:DNA-binding response OmpR family regulator
MMASAPPEHDLPLAPPSISTPRKKRILIVAYDRDVAESIRMTLREHYFLDMQLNVDKAFTFYKLRFYDLVLVEHMKPKIDGYRFCQNIREIDTSVKVCLIMAYDEIGSRMHEPNSHGHMHYALHQESEAIPILKKPFDKATLLAFISQLIGEQ